MHRSFVPFLCILMAASTASAAGVWKKVRSSQGEYLFTLSSVGPQEFFAAGMFIDPGSRFPLPQPVVYWTQDGGKLLKSVMGNLPASAMSGIPQLVHFTDTKNGWLAMGNQVYRTTNRGSVWKGTDAATEVKDLHFHTPLKGIAVGGEGAIRRTSDGGMTWTPVASGTDVDLSCLFWLDSQRGFAAGHKIVEEEDFQGDVTTTYEEGVVLRTADGGQTWTTGFVTDGVMLCPLFFLQDGSHGWLAVTEPGQGDEKRTTAFLYRTTDGGNTFSDMGMDTQVGQLDFMMTVPLNLSYITNLFFEDEFRGHLSGPVFVVEISSGGGGGQPIYRLADLITMDGGKTWQKTDLGHISVNLTGGSMPENDGQAIDGVMRSLFEGWVVGENGAVWIYEYGCTTHLDCGFGYTCNADSRCEALPAPPNPCADGGCPSAPDPGPEGWITDGLSPDTPPCLDDSCVSRPGGNCGVVPRTAGRGPMGMLLIGIGLLVLLKSPSFRSGTNPATRG